jgi:hypothetical protein
MNILTVDNVAYDLDRLPNEIDEDLRYGVLDYSNPQEVDYMFVPLVFLESFSCPAAVLRIGNREVKMPLDWSLVIGEPDHGDPEVISIMSLNDRGFSTFVFNPITGYKPEWHTVEIVNIYQEVKWYVPKLKFGHILAVPLMPGEDPACAFFLKEANKVPEVLDLNKIWF